MSRDRSRLSGSREHRSIHPSVQLRQSPPENRAGAVAPPGPETRRYSSYFCTAITRRETEAPQETQ